MKVVVGGESVVAGDSVVAGESEVDWSVVESLDVL